jgi:hypothetical protein
MPMDRSCLRCGSKALIPDIVVFDHGNIPSGSLEVGVQSRGFLLPRPRSEVTGLVCSACGHVELHVADLSQVVGPYRIRVKAAVEEARKKGTEPSISSCPKCLSLLATKLTCEACGWSFRSATTPDGTA